MRTLLLAVLMMTPLPTIPEALPEDTAMREAETRERLANIGAPCTTQTDINEGTCNIEVRYPNNRKPTWRKTTWQQ